MKEFPGGSVALEDARIWFDEFRTSLFVRINAGAILLSRGVSFQSCGLHSLFIYQSLNVANVYRAPDAAGSARRETNHVTVVIDALANAVDPTEAECFIDGLRPGDAGPAGILFVEANPKLFRFGVISGEPLAEGGGGREEFGTHRGRKRGKEVEGVRMYLGNDL